MMTDVEVNNLALTSAIAAHRAAAKHDDAGFDTAEVLETARLYRTFLLTTTVAAPAPAAQPEFQAAPEVVVAEKPAGTPINPSRLPSRTINILAERGIETIEQLGALTDADVKEWRGLGKQSREALEALLAEHGKVLGDAPEVEAEAEAEAEAEPEPEPEVEAEPKDEDIFGDSAPAEPAEPAITREDVDRLFRKVVQTGGMAAAVKLLEPFKTRKLSEVVDADLPKLHAAASEFLA
jgi:hypothetical protein